MEEPLEPSRPAVTALIAGRNQAGALRRCLKALEASREREKLEILVVDIGSRDESPGLDAEFPGVTILRLPKNFGRAKAWNIGIRTAAAELVLFLSPEVEVAPETVGLLASKLEAMPEAAAVCPLLVDAEGRPATGARALPVPGELYDCWKRDAEPEWSPVALQDGVAEVEWIAMDAMMARKYFIRGLNYFDERYGDSGLDAELCFQIRRSQRKIVVVGEARATRHDRFQPSLTIRAKAARSADRLAGIAAYAGKHFGTLSGLGWRFRAILFTLSNLLIFRNAGYQFRRLMALVSFAKIDGSQAED